MPDKCLYVAGIGPGGYDDMTLRTIKLLESCDVIIGYTLYIELISPYFPGKEYINTPMTKERDRCRMAFEQALKGKKTVLICSGDPGVYGMAGLVISMKDSYPEVDVKIIPGVTAACSGGALAGSPLTGDFAVISLSDILVPWEKIENRLRACASADMPICLYNPGSKKRSGHLRRAVSVVMEYQTPDTVCCVAGLVGREGESAKYCSLKELLEFKADMFSTIFIGKSDTRMIGGQMVTPRV